MSEDVINSIPNNLGLYLEIGVGVIIILFLLFGLLKNWKFSLIQIILFIIALVSVKAICNNIYLSNPEIRSKIDQIAAKIATAIANANDQIGSINSQTGTNLPTIDAAIINSSIMGIAYSIVAAIASIAYALIALVISFLLALAIYLVIRHFIKDNSKYQSFCKKFWYKAIGIVPNCILGLMFGSLVITPIYMTRDIAFKTMEYPGVLTEKVTTTFADEIVEYGAIKATLYSYLETVQYYQEEIQNIEPDINEIDIKLQDADKQVSTLYDVYNGEYLNKANTIRADYKVKLNAAEAAQCEAFINAYFETKNEFDADYQSYSNTKNDFSTTIREYNSAKDTLETYNKKLTELTTSKLDISKLIELVDKLTTIEQKIKYVLPDLKVLGFLVIDCGMTKVNVDGTAYTLNGSYDTLSTYLKGYIDNLISVAKEQVPQMFKQVEEELEKADAEITKYQEELEEKLINFDVDEIKETINEKLSVLDEYSEGVDKIKETIDYWYNKVK